MQDDTAAQAGDGLPLPLVVIGASAGGLDPLEAFFRTAPEQAGWVYVVVQHLSPEYRSMMDELLARHSSLRIRHIEDGLALEPNTIFLNRPSTVAELVDDVFRTKPYREGDRLPHLPIDMMLESLVSRDPRRTAAVILSGSGSDGTRGAQALHRNGAAVLVQTPAEAGFASMPRAVLTAGAVDRVLDAGAIPEAIGDYFAGGKSSVRPALPTDDSGPKRVLKLLEDQHHVDFSAYKPVNVLRRIERRQHLRGFATLEEYTRLLAESPAALDELYQDLLIGVTEFYRDPEAISALRQQVIDPLVAGSSEETPLRIWIPACASGEEAYTIAIELSEAMRTQGVDRKFRIIATDVHRKSIELASVGIYAEQSLAKVPGAIRDRYFTRHRNQYVVEPTLRQKIIFSVHDALSDPPFMHLDLISCRNLLIYLDDEAQARIISMFLFGLRKDGYLLLGPSESLGKYSEEFGIVNRRWRLFQKASNKKIVDREVLNRRIGHETRFADFAVQDRTASARPRSLLGEVTELRNRDTLIRSYDALLKRYAPSSILITAEGVVLGWFGSASAFIDTMNNLADWTVEDIVHPDLHFTINVGMEKLRQGQLERYARRVNVDMGNDRIQPCTLTMEPLEQLGKNKLMLVSIALGEDKDSGEHALQVLSDSGDSAFLTRRIQELERDLRLTEETLQHVTERLEASGEELQASNEELQASNEELQASNEELQSSNEELHAVNEELVSVSAEHETKIEMLSELNRNTELVLRLLGVGVIFVDGAGRIQRFSELIAATFQLQSHDIARPLNIVGPRLDFADLLELATEVIATGAPREVSGDYEGHPITVRAEPVDRDEKGIGAVLIFKGVTFSA